MYLLCVVLVELVVTLPETTGDTCMNLPQRTSRVKDAPVNELNVSSLLDCQDMCLLYPHCTFYEYQPEGESCRLLEKVTKTGIEDIEQQTGGCLLIERPRKDPSECPKCSPECELGNRLTKICKENSMQVYTTNAKLEVSSVPTVNRCLNKDDIPCIHLPTGPATDDLYSRCIQNWASVLYIKCDLTPDIIFTLRTNITSRTTTSTIELFSEDDILLMLIFKQFSRGSKQLLTLHSRIDNQWKNKENLFLKKERKLTTDVWPLQLRICPKQFQVLINNTHSMKYPRHVDRLPTRIATVDNVVAVEFHTTKQACEHKETASSDFMSILGYVHLNVPGRVSQDGQVKG